VNIMPWTNDAESSKHNRHAVGAGGKLWRGVASKVLAKTGDEGRAIREANAVLAGSRHAPAKSKRFGGKKS
jgi:hypothetical protein